MFSLMSNQLGVSTKKTLVLKVWQCVLTSGLNFFLFSIVKGLCSRKSNLVECIATVLLLLVPISKSSEKIRCERFIPIRPCSVIHSSILSPADNAKYGMDERGVSGAVCKWRKLRKREFEAHLCQD